MSAYLASDEILCRPIEASVYGGFTNFVVQQRPIGYAHIQKILGDALGDGRV
jgi:hypothetical protein